MKKPEKKGTNDLHCYCERGLEEYHDCEFSFVHGYNLAIEEYEARLEGVKMEKQIDKDEIVEVLTKVSDTERHNLVTRGLFIKQAEAIMAMLEKKQEQAWE